MVNKSKLVDEIGSLYPYIYFMTSRSKKKSNSFIQKELKKIETRLERKGRVYDVTTYYKITDDGRVYASDTKDSNRGFVFALTKEEDKALCDCIKSKEKGATEDESNNIFGNA